MKAVLQKNRKRLYLFALVVVCNLSLKGQQCITPAGPDMKNQPCPNIAYEGFAVDNNGITYVVSTDSVNNNKGIVRRFNGVSWETIGGSFTNGPIAFHTKTVVDKNNIPYVAYIDVLDSYKVKVKKFNGTSWMQVGSPVTTNSIVSFDIAFDNNNILNVATYDYTLNLIKFNGSNWTTIATGILANNLFYSISLKISKNNQLFIFGSGFGTSLNNSFNLSMMKVTIFKHVGSSLVNFTNYQTPNSQPFLMSYAVDKLDNPYIAFCDSASGYKVNVVKFDSLSWSNVGQYGSISYINSSFVTIAVDTNGIPYVGYSDSSNYRKINVKRYVNNNWSLVGNAGLSGVIGLPRYLMFNINNDLFIAYQENGYFNKTAIKKFDGVQWQILGEEDLSDEVAELPYIAIDKNDIPYISYIDVSLNNYHLSTTVKKYIGNNWITVGNPRFSPNSGLDLSIAFDTNNAIYAVHHSHGALRLEKFDGNNWLSLYPTTPSNNLQGVASLSFALSKTDMPYILYQDAIFSKKASVKKFNGSDWIDVGTPGFSNGTLNYYGTSIAFSPNNIPYICFTDSSYSNNLVVRKFDGTNWIAVGLASIPSSNAYNPKLTFDNQGNLFLAYVDRSNANKPTVRKFDGTNWNPVGSISFTVGAVRSLSFTIDPNGTPYIVFVDSLKSDKATVMKFDGNSWIVVGQRGFTDGLVGGVTIAANNNGSIYIGTSRSDIYTFKIDACSTSGIEELKSDKTNQVYNAVPNPSSGLFTLETNENSIIEVYDIFGKLVYNIKADKDKMTVDISNCKNGIYFAKITGNNTPVGVAKIIKQ
jgi:Secretion system C-terminal sorting domain